MAARLELLGVHEVAEQLGVSVRQVHRLLDRNLLPAPYAKLKCGFIWDKTAVTRAQGALR